MEPLTIIVPFREGHATIERLLDSLPGDQLVIVVDDQSREPYQTHDTRVRVIRLEQRGYFSGAVNRGIRECETDVLVLNQDVWLEGRAWQNLIESGRSTYAAMGETIQGVHPAWPMSYIHGTFMFLRRDAIDRVGLLNEVDYPLWGSTCEWQLRACRAGYKALPVQIPGLEHERKGNYGSAIAATLREQPDLKPWLIRTPPAISVVITSHNYERFLPDALNSLMGGPTVLGDMPGQTFQSFEVIIVDYGSDDPGACQAFADPWKGIHVIRTEDRGTAAACNAGVAAAHGKYITMLDADDLMEPERLEVLYRTIERHPHRVVYDDLRVFRKGQRAEQWQLPDYDFDKIVEKNGMHKGILYPKAAWEECGGYPEIFTDGREDWAFNIALGIRGWCGVYVPQPLYLYRRADHNRTNRNTAPKFYNYFLGKLHSLYPTIYAGERPPMCCGSKKRKPQILPAVKTSSNEHALTGEGGMALLEYRLVDHDRSPARAFSGAATQTIYLFGKQYPQRWVDARDVPGFVEFMGGNAFKVVEQI